ncbi:MAG: tRNA isopentenyl-2-thiomethyl-A-37 hydroxylase MiaE [Planctomycetota bacterium]|nr:tRNA isopentenyl-2-thiomethyl-A-37 hydroxylase MiaE [Planctomycetota bacterium]
MADTASETLPLRWRTPSLWVETATSDPLALLCDHAHLERKAASNALDLLGRWPARVELRDPEDFGPADRWVRVLTSIAQDELRHLAQVLRILNRRGGHLERSHVNPYAAALHKAVRRGSGPRELLDRLCVSALIEARSCERFELLGAHADDPELRRLFASLCQSEQGHYRAFLELAEMLPRVRAEREARWDAWLDIEAEVMQAQAPGTTMHSGVPA